MIALLIALLLSLGVFSAPAQADERPTKINPLSIVTAGDSITAGAGTASRRFGWVGQLHRRHLGETDVDNVARSASCLVAKGCGYSERLVDTFAEEVLSKRPDVAIVAIGRNDLCHVTTAQYVRAAKSLRRQATSVGVDLRFGTITPPNERWAWPCEEQAAEINDWLRTLPGTIDFAAAMSNSDGLLPHRYDHGDGLHPNERGYAVMSNVAEKALGL